MCRGGLGFRRGFEDEESELRRWILRILFYLGGLWLGYLMWNLYEWHLEWVLADSVVLKKSVLLHCSFDIQLFLSCLTQTWRHLS